MLKKIISLTLVIFGSLALIQLATAQYGLKETATQLGYNQNETVYSMVGKVVSIGLSIVALAFFGLMMYAGIRWMTARGNEELSTKAKEALFAAIIGIIVVIASYGIATFVLSRLGGSPSPGEPMNPYPEPVCKSEIDSQQGNLVIYKDTCSRDTKGSCRQAANCDVDKNTILTKCCPGGNNVICCVPK